MKHFLFARYIEIFLSYTHYISYFRTFLKKERIHSVSTRSAAIDMPKVYRCPQRGIKTGCGSYDNISSS